MIKATIIPPKDAVVNISMDTRSAEVFKAIITRINIDDATDLATDLITTKYDEVRTVVYGITQALEDVLD